MFSFFTLLDTVNFSLLAVKEVVSHLEKNTHHDCKSHAFLYEFLISADDLKKYTCVLERRTCISTPYCAMDYDNIYLDILGIKELGFKKKEKTILQFDKITIAWND